MRKFRLSIAVVIVCMLSVFVFSKRTETGVRHPRRTVIEVNSTQEKEAVEFEICLVYSGQPAKIPLKVEKKTTPFRFETTSELVFAIVKCDHPQGIQAKIMAIDKDGHVVATASASAVRTVLRRSFDQCDAAGL